MFMEPRWRRYLRFWRKSVERDVDDELAFHFAERIAELTGRGLSAERAREQALTEFGDVENIRQRLREIDARMERRQQLADRWDSVVQDVRYAARGLGRVPALTITIVVTLT